MPGVSKEQRAEAKYNVKLDFPHLGLHSAAATGNLALVKYALDHGQPINSVLDGLLPLHCACYGGNDTMVRELIAHGADVNSPRLPRRYAAAKSKSGEPPLSIPGSSGSTPLHFACMGGHTAIVLALLLHGAHPDRPDKHGTTPETVARQNGFTTCADVLREWSHNKDKDLREREALTSPPAIDQNSKEKEHSYCGSLECPECATRKRIRMKKSIDSAIHILRHSSSHSSNIVTPPHSAGPTVINTPQPPTPTEDPFGEYTFYPSPDSNLGPPAPRRPSLPYVFEATRAIPTAQRSRRMSNLSTCSTRRPRSAGSDADQSYPPPGQKVKGKVSLLNIFKKANGPPDSNSGSAVTSTSVSPAPTSTLASSSSPPSTDALPTTPSNALSHMHDTFRSHSRGISDTTPHRSPFHASELHSTSRESLKGTPPVCANELSSPALLVRPGILRSHGRTSSGQSSPPADGTPPSSARSLRFDSTSSGRHVHVHDKRQMSRSPPRAIRGAGSNNSLRSRSPGSSWARHRESEMANLNASPALVGSQQQQQQLYEGQIEEEEEEEYGNPVEPHVGMDDKDLLDSPTSSRVKSCFRCPFSINSPPPEPSPSVDDKFLGTGLDGRLRGNSLSSMGTDSSITTPALQHPSLPLPVIASPSYSPAELPSSDYVTHEEDISEKKQDTVVMSTPEKRPRVPLDIDIHTISTHAQVEALVQMAQQRILDMSSDIDDEECRTLGALGVSLGEGRTPLSARLAAYGEVLAIERKFKEDEDSKRRSLLLESSPLSEEPTPIDASRSSIFDRKFSLQDRSIPEGEMRKLRRMHSAGDNSLIEPCKSSGFLMVEPQQNSLSRSNPENFGRLNYHSTSSPSTVTPPSGSTLRSTTLPALRAQVPRSRTPDPEYTSHGTPLSRYPTCPIEDSYNDLVPRRIISAQERQAARAQKLAKMGFAGANDSYRESSQSRSQQRNQRFGGIRNLVQTLTGRT